MYSDELSSLPLIATDAGKGGILQLQKCTLFAPDYKIIREKLKPIKN